VNLGKLPLFPARPQWRSKLRPGVGQYWVGGVSPRQSAPSPLPMLRQASPLAHYRGARPAAAMTIGNATTGLNGTNAPMTVPTAPVRALLISGPRLRLD
jgi:hypothetical protein